MDTITVTCYEGTYSAPSDVVDMMIARYLPTSPAKLRIIVEERAGHKVHATNVATMLVMLADFTNAEMTA